MHVQANPLPGGANIISRAPHAFFHQLQHLARSSAPTAPALKRTKRTAMPCALTQGQGERAAPSRDPGKEQTVAPTRQQGLVTPPASPDACAPAHVQIDATAGQQAPAVHQQASDVHQEAFVAPHASGRGAGVATVSPLGVRRVVELSDCDAEQQASAARQQPDAAVRQQASVAPLASGVAVETASRLGVRRVAELPDRAAEQLSLIHISEPTRPY